MGSETNGRLTLTGPGQPILSPVFVDAVTRKVEKKIASKAMKLLSFIADSNTDGGLIIQHRPMNDKKDFILTEWYKQAMQLEAVIVVKQDLYIDLSLSLDEIRTHYRKSYKPFINRVYENGNIASLHLKI